MQTKAFLPSTSDYTFKKSERLCSKKAFELLFSKGKTVFSYPFKIVYFQEKTKDRSTVQVAFGVSKRNFKRAVKRNKIKRLLREAYRKHKLQPIENINQYFMIIYVSKEIEPYEIIEEKLIKALKQIATSSEKNI